MTGLQPGIGGHLTGAHKGVCEPVTGTPYVGVDQAAAACPATAAEPGSPDFPPKGCKTTARKGFHIWNAARIYPFVEYLGNTAH